MPWVLLLYVVAFILFILEGARVQARYNLVAFGLAAWVLALIIGGLYR